MINFLGDGPGIVKIVVEKQFKNQLFQRKSAIESLLFTKFKKWLNLRNNGHLVLYKLVAFLNLDIAYNFSEK